MVNIFSNLSANIDFNQDWQQLKQISPVFDNEIDLQQYINAKNLACPMPLLKLKVALKKMQINPHKLKKIIKGHELGDLATCQKIIY